MKFPQMRCIFRESKDLKRVWRGVVAKLEDVAPKVSSENWVPSPESIEGPLAAGTSRRTNHGRHL